MGTTSVIIENINVAEEEGNQQENKTGKKIEIQSDFMVKRKEITDQKYKMSTE